jgi:hypothetical protein
MMKVNRSGHKISIPSVNFDGVMVVGVVVVQANGQLLVLLIWEGLVGDKDFSLSQFLHSILLVIVLLKFHLHRYNCVLLKL